MIIAIDYDGTIVEDGSYPYAGVLKPCAKEVINELYSRGHEIIIWTNRSGKELKAALDFLDSEGVGYSCANENVKGMPFTPKPKIYADVFIDDRSLGGLPNWLTIMDILKSQYGA